MQLVCVVVVVVRSGLAVLLRVVVATYEKLSSTVLRSAAESGIAWAIVSR